jgi:hypothetical protein
MQEVHEATSTAHKKSPFSIVPPHSEAAGFAGMGQPASAVFSIYLMSGVCVSSRALIMRSHATCAGPPMNACEALGITIPPTLLMRVDEAIE